MAAPTASTGPAATTAAPQLRRPSRRPSVLADQVAEQIQRAAPVVSDPAAASFNWTAGLFHFDEDQQVGFSRWPTAATAATRAPSSRCPTSTVKAARCSPTAASSLTPAWRVLGGLRYTPKESKYRYGIGGNHGLDAFGAADFGCCVGSRVSVPKAIVPALLNRPSFDLSASSMGPTAGCSSRIRQS